MLIRLYVVGKRTLDRVNKNRQQHRSNYKKKEQLCKVQQQRLIKKQSKFSQLSGKREAFGLN